MAIEIRNLVYTSNLSDIDCEYNHPTFGWIPYTASETDVEKLSRDIHAAALSGEFGEISPYIAPPPSVPYTILKVQFKLALDANKMLDVVTMSMQSAPLSIKMTWDEMQYFSRDSNFIKYIMENNKIDSEKMDALFIEASEIVL